MIHTKGNWAICAKTETQIFIASTKNGARTEEGKGGYICQIKQEREHYGLTEQDEANAKLICAAPTLLNTIERCEFITDRCNNAMLPQHIQDLLKTINKELNDAINAATGESNMHPIFKEALAPFGIK